MSSSRVRGLMVFSLSVSLSFKLCPCAQDLRWQTASKDKQWQPSATTSFRMRGRKICAQTASSPKRSTARMAQGQLKARVAIWQPCTPAVPILGGRISRHLRYVCANHFNNILSHLLTTLIIREGGLEDLCFFMFNVFMWTVVSTVMNSFVQ